MIYDLFYVSFGKIKDENWNKFHSRFPVSQKVENVKSINDIKSKSFTKLFWVVWDDIEVLDDNVFDYVVPKWDENYIHVFKNGEFFDGINIFPKSAKVTDKEFQHRFFFNKKEIDRPVSRPRPYDVFVIETYEDYLNALETSSTEMFWMTGHNLKVSEDFNFNFHFTYHNRLDISANHSFIHRMDPDWVMGPYTEVKDRDLYNGIHLLSKYKPVSKKEIEHRFLAVKREWPIAASGPVKYDIFNIESYDDYLRAMEESKTEMFWMVSPNLDTSNFEFNVYFSHNQQYERSTNHAFIHKVNGRNQYNGVYLLSKKKPVSKKEIEHRYLIEKKEWPIVASGPVKYDIFSVETYDEYLKAMEESKTEMFWMTSPNIDTTNFNFDVYFSHDQQYERSINHSFVHLVNGKRLYNGLYLMSKKKAVSKKEIEHRFLIEKKEWPIIASGPVKYDIFNIETYDDYLKAMEESKTEMFWMTSPNLDTSNFNFDVYFTHNEHQYERSINHSFVHLVNGKKLYNGVHLLSKKKSVSKKEIEHRFLIEKKEWPIVASGPVKYDQFVIQNYDDYLQAMDESKTEMFWMIPKEVEVLDNFSFDLYFTHDNIFDRKSNHVFKHMFRGEETYTGVSLVPKIRKLTKKEVDFRHIIERKEHTEIASRLKPYDIIFISYNETNADENFSILSQKYPRVKRVHGVKGIHNAHIEAAKLSETDMFWVVDGDARIEKDFNFDYEVSRYELDIVHVWKSKNPINDLIYGYGGVKLLPKFLTENMNMSKPDMTTSISSKFKAMPTVSNVTHFDTDPFNTWKSAFRECVKLSSKVIDRQEDTETIERLDVWCNAGADKPFGKYAISGAIAGRKYGEENKNNIEALSKINDFDWLKKVFDEQRL